MKSGIILFILSFFVFKTSSEQDISKAEIIRFKINSVSTTDEEGKNKGVDFYDEKGNCIRQGSLNEDHKLHIDRELFYKDSSQLTEERIYTVDGDINSILRYYYNTKNQLIKKEANSYGKVEATWIYEYDSNGNKVSETQTSGTMGNSTTTYKYDAANLLVQEDKANSTIGKEARISYIYSDKKLIIEKMTKLYYFNTIITLTYLYNDTGKVSKLIEKSSNGVSSTTIYEYNDKGLLIADTWESSISKIPHKTLYQIKFE